MSRSLLFEGAVETAQRIWGIEPVRGIRMPEPSVQQTVAIDALWTDGGLRPRANNLAFLIQRVSDQEDLKRWKQRLKVWTVRGGLFVLDELYLIQPGSEFSGELEQELDLPSWHQTLVSPKPHLFTPKALANLRQGQLSLADLEEDVDERSFSFLDRQQKRISDAFQEGIDAALRRIDSASSNSSRTEIKGHVIRFSIAYLAARILQDKNFFGSNTIIQPEDPISLLDRMIEITNGFFRRARRSAEYVPEVVRQELAVCMGDRVSFVLTDHRDVGRLYEEAIKKLPRELGSEDWGDLNRHYTPVKLAERMLEALPLERIRPEERFIFDPAAGSGSLLLAATSRLAGMIDIPLDEKRKEYLRSYVVGNDLDRYANLVAQLRYFLASESLGIASETSKIADVLPFPSSFTSKDYKEFTQESLPVRPRIIVANPPFAIDGNIQKSANFVEQATSWLQQGDQFAFVLPSSFLTGGNKFGVAKVRERLAERCEIFESWQCPVGTVGINARQDVCVVTGAIGSSRHHYIISRKVISGAESSAIRDKGYLGFSWIARTRPDDYSDWTKVIAPDIHLSIPTIPLRNLFFIFTGVQHYAGDTPVGQCPEGKSCKLTWRMTWVDEGSLWANPNKADQSMRFVIYDPANLERLRLKVAHLFSKPKILVGRIANISSKSPLTAQLDTIGLCPNNSIWCILPIEEAGRKNKGFTNKQPENWSDLTFIEKKLWLLGILASEIGAELSMSGRATINLTEDVLLRFPLPSFVDKRIIDKVAEILHEEQSGVVLQNLNLLRQELNYLVEESYGKPSWISSQRVGISPDYEEWQIEQKKRTLSVTGQVLEISQERAQVLLRLSGLLNDNEEEWLPLPQELPGWALDGTVFRTELSEDIETFQELAQRPWALRKFRHTPYPYLTSDDLNAKISRIIGLENR